VANRLDFGFEDLGEQELKNIDKPVRVYRVLLDPEASGTLVGEVKPKKNHWKWAALAACIVLVLGAVVWFKPWIREITFSTSPLSAKASIAVLPFSNLSKDPEQEYFSDGITNDLITDLSKFHDLLVIASNSVFTYKGKPVQVQKVGRDLGVRYVLEGSVQRLGGRVRINVQLIDTSNGRHLWAERYNEPVTDLFELQDRITRRIVRTLAVRLTRLEQDRAFTKSTRNLKAYDYVLRGRHLLRHVRRAENFKAREMFQKAVDLDPDYASAYAGLGETYLREVIYGWPVGPPQEAVVKAHDMARRAIAIDGNNADAHILLGAIYLLRRQHEFALVQSERAIALNPNDAGSYAAQGKILVWSGHPEGAILSLETALRFDPMMGEVPLTHLGLAYYLKGRYKDALKVLERGIGLNPDFAFGQTMLAATYGEIGNQEGASRAAQAVRRLNPFFSTDQFGRLLRNSQHAARVVDGLHKAGLD
jgi:adenylate cyclase